MLKQTVFLKRSENGQGARVAAVPAVIFEQKCM
jgi:hypothetical protein